MKQVGSVLLVLSLVAMALPTNVAAQTLEEVEILTEDAGDVAVSSAGADAPSSDRFQTVDVTGLYIAEDIDYLYFRIEMADAHPENEIIILEQGVINVDFTLGEDVELPDTQLEQEGAETRLAAKYRVVVFHQDGTGRADLERWDPALERYVDVIRICDFCGGPGVELDNSRESWIVPVPRDYLLDNEGSAVRPGMPMHSFLVDSEGWFNGAIVISDGGLFDVDDQMPDDGVPVGSFDTELGISQSGHLRLDSIAPVRASNGEATTYVYDVVLTSTADFVDDVNLGVVGVLDAWEVKLPADSVRIDNGTVIHLPILVTVPFGHQHGEFVSFVLEAKSTRDMTAAGRIELGVRYTTIPQPAGHHSQLWLHSSEESFGQLNDAVDTVIGGNNPSYAYFNAIKGTDDPRDAEINIAGQRGGITTDGADRPVAVRYNWDIYLEPTLQMGLDFDLSRTGSLTFPVEAVMPLQNAYIEGTMYYIRTDDLGGVFIEEEGRFSPRGEPTILGTFAPSDVLSGSSATFETEFTPTPEADFLPYDPNGASVWMNIELVTLAPTTIFADGLYDPELVPGGEMTLPLNEYHDPVDDLYVTLTDVDIRMESPQERYVNSGEAVLFEVRIQNTGVVNDEFTVALSGHNDEWAMILGDSTFPVKSKESRRIVVAVVAPTSAAQGDTADLVLETVSSSDDNARALVRLYAEVDDLIDHEDQSYLIPVTSQDLTYVPVGNWLAPLALLGAVVAMRARKQD